MTLNNKYTVLPTSTFKEELKEIIFYFKYKLSDKSSFYIFFIVVKTI